MEAAGLMTRAVCACHPEWSLEQVARRLWDSDCGCAPVVDGENRLVGMITDRDICMAALMRGRPIGEIEVASAMSQTVHACKADDSLETVASIMRERHVRRVPVIDDERRVVGIISIHDFATCAIIGTREQREAVSAADVTQTLAQICRPRFDRTPGRGD